MEGTPTSSPDAAGCRTLHLASRLQRRSRKPMRMRRGAGRGGRGLLRTLMVTLRPQQNPTRRPFALGSMIRACAVSCNVARAVQVGPCPCSPISPPPPPRSFMANFAARMLAECGVAVVDMSLEDVRITDKTLAEAMARGAVARADLAKATVERQIKLTSSEADKASEILRAEGQASATGIIAAAEANRVKLMDDTFSLLKSPITSQRETLLAAGEVLRGSNSTLVLSASPLDAANMLGGGGGGMGAALMGRSGGGALRAPASS